MPCTAQAGEHIQARQHRPGMLNATCSDIFNGNNRGPDSIPKMSAIGRLLPDASAIFDAINRLLLTRKRSLKLGHRKS